VEGDALFITAGTASLRLAVGDAVAAFESGIPDLLS
jgi:hypothetical protein